MQIELFDTVELLVDLPAHHLYAGARGAVIEQYGETEYEIEFANEEGETEQIVVLPADSLLVVWRNATKTWVSLPEQMAQLAARLNETERREVMDFARFLHARRTRQQVALPDRDAGRGHADPMSR